MSGGSSACSRRRRLRLSVAPIQGGCVGEKQSNTRSRANRPKIHDPLGFRTDFPVLGPWRRVVRPVRGPIRSGSRVARLGRGQAGTVGRRPSK